MDQTVHPNTLDTRKEVERAEKSVAINAERFDTAMDMLANKVEDTSAKVQNAANVVERSKARVNEMQHKARTIVAPARPYIDRAVATSRQATTQLRQNPRPYGLALAGLFASWLVYRVLAKRAESRRYKPAVETNSRDVEGIIIVDYGTYTSREL